MPSFLSLGTLHRTLAELVASGREAAIGLHFEQRSATHRADEESVPAELLLARRFDAALVTRDGGVMRAELPSGGRSRSPAGWLSLVRVDDTYAYTVDGSHFGWLHQTPDLFDLSRFQDRLDSISVADVTAESAMHDGESVVVLDADVGVAAFRRLLSLFGGDHAEDEIDLRSYSVTLSAGPDVSLDYWWSLARGGRGGSRSHRQTIACHVLVTVAPARVDHIAAPPGAETTLPVLRHIDEVWQLARASSSAPG